MEDQSKSMMKIRFQGKSLAGLYPPRNIFLANKSVSFLFDFNTGV